MRDPTLCVAPSDGPSTAFESLAVPVHRASTVVFPTVAAYQGRRDEIYDGFSYGLYGTPTSRELEVRLSRLEGAARTLVLPSGFAAIALTTLAAVAAGRRVLFPDSIYDTVRPFAEQFLAGLGIRSGYYDPLIGGEIAAILTADDALVWVESPGSMTMEVQDVPAIAAAAHAVGAKVAADNTWATPLRFKALGHGVDFSVCALSKYVAGHSDVMMGSVSVADVALYRRLKDFSRYLGYGVSADESSLVLRGLETLAIRMRGSLGAHAGRLDRAAGVGLRGALSPATLQSGPRILAARLHRWRGAVLGLPAGLDAAAPCHGGRGPEAVRDRRELGRNPKPGGDPRPAAAQNGRAASA
jgi:cystathionine beta-lyase